MGAGEILLLLCGSGGCEGETWEPLVGAPKVTRADFSPIEGIARPFSTAQGRSFDLMVEFGALMPDSARTALTGPSNAAPATRDRCRWSGQRAGMSPEIAGRR